LSVNITQYNIICSNITVDMDMTLN